MPRLLRLFSELDELLRPSWPAMLAQAHAAGPTNAEDDGGDAGAAADEDDDKGGSGDAGGDDKGGKAGGDDKGGLDDEVDKLKESLAEANKELRKLKNASKRAEKDGKVEAGKYEELFKDANEKAERLEGLITTTAKREAVREIAGKLRYRNPAVADRLIDLDDIDVDVDVDGETIDAVVGADAKVLIEKRLKDFAEANDYVVGDAPARQLPGAGRSSSGSGGNKGNEEMNQAIRRAAGR